MVLKIGISLKRNLGPMMLRTEKTLLLMTYMRFTEELN